MAENRVQGAASSFAAEKISFEKSILK
jgi:hypothetical protein